MPSHEIEDRYHYQVIRRAIAEIDRAEGTLTLDALASRLGMSGAHFQRVFTAWVGVSPKRYQQYLTLGHAKALLAARFSTQAAADGAGLSGSGRLHDLFVRWEAMTPGTYAQRGAGLTIRHGWFDTPFGPALGMATERGLCGLAFANDTDPDATLADMTRRWPAAVYVADQSGPAPHIAAAFGGAGDGAGRARLHLIGAPFQIKVWEALLTVPSGHVTSYGTLAQAVGAPRAARAVGSAVGANPLGFVIPCHRCLRGDGGLGGYHWGLTTKRAMLGWEAARLDAHP
ncbi:methylated-DNA--[protein]-cysteine S-methyltransferase [Roseicitreum antarcticum]|uniref:methylated-DNA--[protein]-cysteine S-methyltransferase n=1 Tax=Roseicitreum antarcticum TaxID=564137 RepID=A0A1H2RTL5_9RHOB|nr:bifunctional helix-turn-helix domain-containing protein/methylated-DNA--[protein]-cysteine S-methyltransferase [Roseicitreum antarcticum]SDW22618.1 AraC family transcriptional regulator, regulatory protein of adaptative response / methylated-DNA-[protein]-cysteine methyltransferase [Roseicitreum antarcticum]